MSRSKNYSKEFKTQIINLYLAGQSATKLSRSYELNTSTIYSWIKAHKESLKAANIDINPTKPHNKVVACEERIQYINAIAELQEQLHLSNEKDAIIASLKTEVKVAHKSIKELKIQASILKQAALILGEKKRS